MKEWSPALFLTFTIAVLAAIPAMIKGPGGDADIVERVGFTLFAIALCWLALWVVAGVGVLFLWLVIEIIDWSER